LEVQVKMKLTEMVRGEIAQIVDVGGGDLLVCAKLREIGFAEGDEVEILHFGPIGKKPICIRLNHTLIALRPEEADNIIVERT